MRRPQLPQYDDGKAYVYDPLTGKWNRYTNTSAGKTFVNTTVTPDKTRLAFNYENKPVKFKMPNVETADQYTQRRMEEVNVPYTFGTNAADLISTAVGFTPAGTIESGLNAVNSTIKGNYTDAALYGAGMVPGGGFLKKIFGGIGRFFKGLFSSKYRAMMRRNKMAEHANDAIYGAIGGGAAAYGANLVSDGNETASSLAGLTGFAAGVKGRRALKNYVDDLYYKKINPKIHDAVLHPTQTAIETINGNYPWTSAQLNRVYDKNLSEMAEAIDDFFPQRRADSEHVLPKVGLNVRGTGDDHIDGVGGLYDATDPNNPTIHVNLTSDRNTNLGNQWATNPDEYTTPKEAAIHEYNHHILRNNEGLKYTKYKEGYTRDGLHYKDPHAWDENSPVAEEAKILFANLGWASSVDEFDSELSAYMYDAGLGYTSYPGNEIINRLAEKFDLPVAGVLRLANAIIVNRIDKLSKNGVKSLDSVVK